MSNDNKTLADVLPGGRVRLATVPYDRARDLIGDAYNAGTHGIGYSQQAMELQDAIIPAQHSPGGQDALAALQQDYDKPLDSFNRQVEVAEKIAGRVLQQDDRIEELEEALAARQPVGEPVGQVRTRVDGGFIAELLPGVADRVSNLAPLYAAPPPQQPAQVYLDGLDRALGEAIDQRDRYHEVADDLAGHIAAITGVDIGEHSSANCPWQNAIEAAEEYKPAQAVDLPYSLDADPAGIRARVCDVITGTLMVGAQGHTPPPAGHWAEPFWQAARADATAQAVDLGQFREPIAAWSKHCAHSIKGYESYQDSDLPDWMAERRQQVRKCGELLALIDSQAVGNG